jgi:hypothetical protein
MRAREGEREGKEGAVERGGGNWEEGACVLSCPSRPEEGIWCTIAQLK